MSFTEEELVQNVRKPLWIRVKLPSGTNYLKLRNLLIKLKINTICNEARCPNISECSSKGVATFLLLGNKCTRNCLYCNVNSTKPNVIDIHEPLKISNAVKEIGLKYVVITSVTRDDLEDGGASIFVETVHMIKKLSPHCKIELLIPDFSGNDAAVTKIVNSEPYVIGHNLEVAEEIFKTVRPQGNFHQSLKLLKFIKKLNIAQKTKSGLMVGLGEKTRQVINVMEKLRKHEVDIITIGQYLQPSRKHYPVKKYYTDEEFREFEKIGYRLGFSLVKSGPLVRSSYMAEEVVN